MSTTWVVVAESSRAKIYALEKKFGPLEELRDFVHTQSRKRPADITSDLPGRSFSSVGGSRHAMEPPTDPKRHEIDTFAAEIATHIEHARGEGRFEALVLVAAPKFLGMLRGHLSDATRAVVAREIRKNLTREDAETLKRALSEER